MKKAFFVPFLSLLTFFIFLQIGCGGSDDPATPPPEDCSIDVTGPVPGAEYLEGDHVNINWAETGDASQAVIQLLKGEHVVETIGTVDNDGYQGWAASTMGAASGSDFAIRVTAAGETGCSDDSGRFSIINTVGCGMSFTVGDTARLDEGQDYDITWESNNTSGWVDIQLMRQDQPIGIVASNIQDDGHFLWTVDSFHQGTYEYYFLKINDRTVDGCDDETTTFGIIDHNICEMWVHNPQPHVVWEYGETKEISFTALDENTTHVNLRLYEGNQFVNTVAIMVPVEATGVEQFVSWVVDDTGSDTPAITYRIKVIDGNDPYCVAWSADFTIPAHR